jgi:hypothetical protein
MSRFGMVAEHPTKYNKKTWKHDPIEDKWRVYLPHKCDEWGVTYEPPYVRNGVTQGQAVKDLEAFIVEAQRVLDALKEGIETKS